MTFSEEEKARAREVGAGPYQSEDGEYWWFPTSHWTWNLAQAEAKSLADESDCVARYMGIEAVVLHDHEDWEYSDHENCPEGGCPSRRSYHFEWDDRWSVPEHRKRRS